MGSLMFCVRSVDALDMELQNVNWEISPPAMEQINFINNFNERVQNIPSLTIIILASVIIQTSSIKTLKINQVQATLDNL